MKFLIIEDYEYIVESISIALEMHWPDAYILSTSLGEKGIEMVEAESPDAVILDLGLPDIDGFDVLKRIRRFSKVPILILTVKSEESDIVKGLEWGADDYMVKPFRQMELLARIKGIVRRNQPRREATLVCGQLRFEPNSLKVVHGTKEIKISHTEGIILGCLMKNVGNVVTYSSLAEAIWGGNFPKVEKNIRVHIRHLRKKLEVNPDKPKIISNQAGIGYYMVSPS